MSKVICDICGTVYPETAAGCPVCGSSREYALGSVEDDFPEEILEETSAAPRKKNKEIFDYDEVNQEKHPADEDDFEDEEIEDEEPRTNVGLVIVLVILIALLLLAAGFFFLKYLLPNMGDKEPVQTAAPTVAAVVETEPVVTENPTIPCTNLMMDGGRMELGRDGKKLLNVRVYPADTTDALVYISGDEAVVTVSDDGSVTAVGEGQTTITVQCGAQKITCTVTVDYSAGVETTPEGGIPGLTVEEGNDETVPQETVEASGETQPAQTEETAETTEATEETTPADMVLKLKKTDITISFLRTSVTLELDCDIDPKEVTWFTMDSGIAIVNDGVVTSMNRGTTKIYAEYKGQQVACIVRCN